MCSKDQQASALLSAGGKPIVRAPGGLLSAGVWQGEIAQCLREIQAIEGAGPSAFNDDDDL